MVTKNNSRPQVRPHGHSNFDAIGDKDPCLLFCIWDLQASVAERMSIKNSKVQLVRVKPSIVQTSRHNSVERNQEVNWAN